MQIRSSLAALLLVLGGTLLLSSCVGIPNGATAVSPFDAKRYVGKWYEIARLDMRFERNMNNTTATYTANNDGSIQVLNRGYDTLKATWKQAQGKAKFVGSKNEGRLKVSFFGPFYAGYNVIALDENYRYALVAGSNLKYLWILSREKTIPQAIRNEYVAKAKSLGYATDELSWVEHDK